LSAGALSNRVADRYMSEMVETYTGLTDQEKSNAAIFK